jgi:hypothetical protein
MKTSIDRQFRKFEISEDGVKIKFVEIITQPPSHPENENKISVRKYNVECDVRPHPDLTKHLKALKTHVFAINEMELVDTKDKTDYQVVMVQVDGDMLMQKSRVKFLMGKSVDRTVKNVTIGPTSQVTMYGESDYHDHEKMSKIVEDFTEEVWLYLSGKYSEQIEGQLPLFAPLQMEGIV